MTKSENHVFQCVASSPSAVGAGTIGIEVLHQRRNGGAIRGGQCGGIGVLCCIWGECTGGHRFGVGGVVTRCAANEGVFTHLDGGEELFTHRATHGAAHRLHDGVGETEALENPFVRIAVVVVTLCQTFIINIEGVAVLHEELTATQETSTGARLISIFGLDLIQRNREVLVTAVQILHQKGKHLFVGGSEKEIGAFAVLQTKQVVAIFGPAAGGFIDIAGQKGGKMHFLGTNGIHFFTNDVFHLAQDPPAQRQPGVATGGSPADVAGSEQQSVRGDFRIGRVIAEGANEEV